MQTGSYLGEESCDNHPLIFVRTRHDWCERIDQFSNMLSLCLAYTSLNFNKQDKYVPFVKVQSS